MICFKIRIFVVESTPFSMIIILGIPLWFALKFVSLWWNQHLAKTTYFLCAVVICFKIRIFVVESTPKNKITNYKNMLWFALKFVSLWWNQHLQNYRFFPKRVVICFKIRIFVVESTPIRLSTPLPWLLWFALKFVSLWWNQHRLSKINPKSASCDLL